MKTLYLTDLDGTLLRSDERLSKYALDTINRFIESDGCFSYATGRSIATASKVTVGLNLAADIPVICHNGAFIIGNKSNKIMQSNFFAQDETVAIKRVLIEHDISPIIYAHISDEEKFTFINCPISDGMRFFLDSRKGDPRCRIVTSIDDLYMGDVFSVICISNDKELAPVHEIFKQDKRFQCIYHKEMYSNAWWCEILPQNATKANAALQLKKMLNCDKLVVFGDGLNDLSLFSVADECYAMSNAVPELKEIATAIIETNNNDGVAKWIEKNML